MRIPESLLFAAARAASDCSLCFGTPSFSRASCFALGVHFRLRIYSAGPSARLLPRVHDLTTYAMALTPLCVPSRALPPSAARATQALPVRELVSVVQ